MRRLQNLSGPKELRGAQLPASCRPKASLMPADRVPLEDHAVARDRLRRDAAARNFQRPHSDIARLVIRCSQCPRATTAPRTGHPLSARGCLSAAFMISKTVTPFRDLSDPICKEIWR